MNRRGFLQACLASATAPYVVTAAGVLMPVRKIVTFGGWVRHPLGGYLTDHDDWYIARDSIFKGDIITLTPEGIRRAMHLDTLNGVPIIWPDRRALSSVEAFRREYLSDWSGT